MTEKKIPLTSAEIGMLWTAYMNFSVTKCVLGFMLKSIEDPEIKQIVQYTYDLSSENLTNLEDIFQKENFAVPSGFNEKEDVNESAPWLFTDIFCLTYVIQMANIGIITFGAALSMSARKDIRELFTEAVHQVIVLYNQSTEISVEKGINTRHPYIEVPKEIDFVDDKKYLSGLNPFNDKRPLNSIEISHLYQNITSNTVGTKLCLAFAQTSPTKEVQEFMLRAKEISKKHIQVCAEKLLNEDITAPQLPDIAVSDSTTQTFSDKLSMFHISLMMSAGIGNYATAGAASQRSDLMLDYERLSIEVARLAKSGADIMITNKWLEQPPGTVNREKLAKNKGES